MRMTINTVATTLLSYEDVDDAGDDDGGDVEDDIDDGDGDMTNNAIIVRTTATIIATMMRQRPRGYNNALPQSQAPRRTRPQSRCHRSPLHPAKRGTNRFSGFTGFHRFVIWALVGCCFGCHRADRAFMRCYRVFIGFYTFL